MKTNTLSKSTNDLHDFYADELQAALAIEIDFGEEDLEEEELEFLPEIGVFICIC